MQQSVKLFILKIHPVLLDEQSSQPCQTADAEDYSDMPGLMDEPDATGPATESGDSESQSSDDEDGFTFVDPDATLLQLIPSTDEVDDALAAYVDNPVSPPIVERLFGLE